MVIGLVILLLAVVGIAGVCKARAGAAAHPAQRPLEIMLGSEDLRRLLARAKTAAAPVSPLEPGEIFRKLRDLAFGVATSGEPPPEYAAVAAATIAALEDPATLRQQAPRRPSLLPKLIHAVNDDAAPRRELAAVIARDPSLVGSLLRMANSSFYRVTDRPVESIDRAVVLLGSDGIRSLIAAAAMQPIFRVSGRQFARFPETVWEHAWRSANAAVVHAAAVERADPFAAELLSLVWGLADVVLFRTVLDRYEARGPQAASSPDVRVIATLLDSRSAAVAHRIAAGWELSERSLAALEEQCAGVAPATPLGRSLRFGRIVGALAVLRLNQVVDEATARASLPRAGLTAEQTDRMWTRLIHEPASPPTPTTASRPAAAPPRARAQESA